MKPDPSCLVYLNKGNSINSLAMSPVTAFSYNDRVKANIQCRRMNKVPDLFMAKSDYENEEYAHDDRHGITNNK